jgi:signal peptidase I
MLLRRLGAFFLDILEVIVLATSIFLLIYLLVMQPHKIKGDSMQPNFPNGEYLLTDKVTYRFREPERGEVIVFEAPGTNGDEFIKRIIGLPGEKIKVNNGKIYINSKMLEESYLSNFVITQQGAYLTEGKEVLLPEGHYAVLGDNRSASSDTRAWGFISKDKITGRAWLVYWPPKALGIIEDVTYQFN